MEHKTIHYNAVEFGRRIRTIRKQKKMTQQELAELLFLSEESVSNFETGKTMCMPEHVIQMCQIKWADRDRFVLSNGHGSMLIYKLQGNDGIERIFQRLKGCNPFELSKIEQIIDILLAKPAA